MTLRLTINWQTQDPSRAARQAAATTRTYTRLNSFTPLWGAVKQINKWTNNYISKKKKISITELSSSGACVCFGGMGWFLICIWKKLKAKNFEKQGQEISVTRRKSGGSGYSDGGNRANWGRLAGRWVHLGGGAHKELFQQVKYIIGQGKSGSWMNEQCFTFRMIINEGKRSNKEWYRLHIVVATVCMNI